MLPVDARPYFFENEEWYYYDEKEGRLKLTNKAPQKAIDSYKEFYKVHRDKEGNIIHR